MGTHRDPPTWSACPGCGLAMPGLADLHAGGAASEACWQLYSDVTGYELAHLPVLGRLRQLTVDTYAAQHAGGSTPSLAVAFALIGLRLALDEGWRGDQVRAAHRALAAGGPGWPPLRPLPPPGPAGVTVFDVALADSPEGHAAEVERWAAAVWDAWGPAHPAVIALAEMRLPDEMRGRIKAGR